MREEGNVKGEGGYNRWGKCVRKVGKCNVNTLKGSPCTEFYQSIRYIRGVMVKTNT